MKTGLAQSLAYSRRVARQRARNFYYSFVLLRRQEHDAMCALYAFLRYCDDIADDCPTGPDKAQDLLARWRTDLEDALAGRAGGHPVWPAFLWALERYRIPHDYFRSMIDGVESDLSPREFRTFPELYQYCYRVASVAGLSVIHILGYESERAPQLAEKCGIAFQLTNIIRDIREDAERGRLYLPSEDLAEFRVDRADFVAGRAGEGFRALLRFEAARAREYYREAAPLVGMVARRNRASLAALIEIYRRLLDKIERSGFDVWNRRIRLSAAEKCLIVARAAMGGRAPGRQQR
ncbi:MAG TPA: phytoene/squalene synthase family protein [Bryobacteraceae bacterium]|nr:phytoene/squalene synthase family protein [Bryobacteraceae bacterium]